MNFSKIRMPELKTPARNKYSGAVKVSTGFQKRIKPLAAGNCLKRSKLKLNAKNNKLALAA